MSSRPKILIVDDEDGIRESLSSILRDEQYTVDAVASGGEALERITSGEFEVVLLDIWLPGMDGLETLARIQEIPFADRPVVVIISGHGIATIHDVPNVGELVGRLVAEYRAACAVPASPAVAVS